MADALQAARQKLQELQIEVQSIGQNLAIVTKTINADLRDLSEELQQIETEKVQLQTTIKNLENEAAQAEKPVPKKEKKDKDFSDAVLKGEKQ